MAGLPHHRHRHRCAHRPPLFRALLHLTPKNFRTKSTSSKAAQTGSRWRRGPWSSPGSRLPPRRRRACCRCPSAPWTSPRRRLPLRRRRACRRRPSAAWTSPCSPLLPRRRYACRRRPSASWTSPEAAAAPTKAITHAQPPS